MCKGLWIKLVVKALDSLYKVIGFDFISSLVHRKKNMLQLYGLVLMQFCALSSNSYPLLPQLGMSSV